MTQATLDHGTALAIVEGRHGDPFSVLGPHQRGKDWVVTAFVPGAEKLWVVAGGKGAKPVEAQGVAGFDGLFEARLPRMTDYRLRAQGHGNEWEFEDAYRFGPVLGEIDEYLLGEGTHRRIWQVLGAHLITHEGVEGTHFAVWAPNAQRVSVVGDFNIWDGRRNPMRRRGATGVWEAFIPGLKDGASYKYEIRGEDGSVMPLKADPVGFGSEHPPANASVVRDIRPRAWADQDWMATRQAAQNIEAAMTIYEVHLGSWKRAPGNRMLSYLELAEQLVDYVADMGFTHIELMPVSEYPFDGSWGYQPVGLFAPTIRHGTPQEFRVFVEAAHRRNIGVLLDWVPGHFPTDQHGLGRFDGTALYEHQDPREGFHQDWNTFIYNYGRTEVSNYLISNALYWLEEFHIDGLRVDAVASMLYRDYSRAAGQWIPNKDGGRENYEAIAVLQRTNIIAYGEVPGIVTVAEESTAFPGVSRPASHGGLGFGFKWNMGWMNDTLSYMQKDPVFRKYHHHQMTFGLVYAWSENYILPISHDEVVHGKGSMLSKMPGNAWEKFANLRAYYGFMWGHPGKKLLFMGCEFGQGAEWNHKQSLDWHQLDIAEHRGVQSLVRDLNRLYRATPALHVNDTRPEGFQWLEGNDADGSTYAWLRRGRAGDPMVVVAVNMTPVERRMRLGLPAAGHWDEVLNSDAGGYGGGNRGNLGGIDSDATAWHGQPQSALVTLPPLSAVYFRQALTEYTASANAAFREDDMQPRPNARLSSQAMAFVLAGGRGSRLKELTDRRVKPAVYFGGKTRIIDFALSNALNSGIRKMAIATQYKAHSLIRHMQRGWGFFRAERNEYLDILPASQRVEENKWYVGTADAVTQNIDIVDSYGIKYVVILAGDHIYKMDYEIMLQQHVDSGADVTIGCLTVPRMEAVAFGVMHVDKDLRITDFLEKPKDPPSIPGDPDHALASMGIYVFDWAFLRDLLIKDAEDSNSSHDFGNDIIPGIVKNGKAVAHKFADSCVKSGLETEPYWRDVGTVDAFWRANIDLTDFIPKLDIYDQSWPIWTYSEIVPPAKFIHDEDGRRGMAISSLVSGDCIVSGSEVRNSLLFTGCRTHSFSSLEYVVALPQVVVNRKAELKNCVIDRGVVIPEGLVVGKDPEADAKWFRRTDNGIVLITQDMVDARAKALG